MARDFVTLGDGHAHEVGLVPESSGGLFLLCMLILSLSVLFACGDESSSNPRKNKDLKKGCKDGGGHGGDGGGGGCGCGDNA
ncbi:hypothetical protein L1049_023553 [Liquidambar formosana]|uniref:Uncharacterized protein n=1 Tax=Liquidambar formosana TaxID=63359 RepID=A0AAP0RTN1_LIQFO